MKETTMVMKKSKSKSRPKPHAGRCGGTLTCTALPYHPGGLAVQLHCSAGCSAEAIAAALGLSIRDLYYDTSPPTPVVEPTRVM
jgi:hypothetical protein